MPAGGGFTAAANGFVRIRLVVLDARRPSDLAALWHRAGGAVEKRGRFGVHRRTPADRLAVARDGAARGSASPFRVGGGGVPSGAASIAGVRMRARARHGGIRQPVDDVVVTR